ncbi:MAG: helix-turn-helix transcriptional regulator [Alicyclobacillaceae bacterium]|nr:helix-turn-helix transcriptional regulator [Alicyclobacillaceae bacterium]
MDIVTALKALSNPVRLQILEWLKDPSRHFPPQEAGDFDRDGVCVSIIRQKAGLSQSTVSQYLAELQRAGLVRSKRIGQWTYYRRDEEGIRRLLEELNRSLS